MRKAVSERRKVLQSEKKYFTKGNFMLYWKLIFERKYGRDQKEAARNETY
ncbi:MAG: hypothetical protein NC432_03340 [Roseburia sp.]|nr:hypothetical protein [Roseburia sp.]MCM1098379.1 hypothetical protein [Ruminococcus flavefaciens]